MTKKKEVNDTSLLKLIVESIKEKKGREIVSINLERTGASICDYFVICHAGSTSQVEAIADSVERKVKEGFNIKAGHIEGYQNAHWILIDYASIVVHIFLAEFRTYYALEDLWADGIIKKYKEDY